LEGKRRAAPIGEILKSVFAGLESRNDLTKEDVEFFWKEWAGEDAFKHSKPTGLRKGVLTIRVDSSVWLQELVMKKRQLLKGLKTRLGKDRITEIHFKIGEF